MKALVTGATGFLGGAIAREAVGRAWEVTALHRGRPAEIAGVKWRTLGEVAADKSTFDLVIHVAALRHRHGIAPEEYQRTNSELTRRVIAQARGAGRLVYVSSVAVYGWPRELPIDERNPHAPVGPYGHSKIHCEGLVRGSGMPFTIVQPSITYGPGDTNGMMDKILRMVAARRFVLCGLGESRVQLVYVDDVARIVCEAAFSERARGETFICTYREPIRMRELAALCGEAVGKWVPPVGPPKPLLWAGAVGLEALDRLGLFRGGEPPVTREKLSTVSVDRAYRIDHMRAVLGTEPQIGYAEGLRRTARALGLA